VTDPLHDRLRGALATVPRLRLAILFGSRARGNARPDSDVDVAILAEPPLSGREETELGAALERAAGTSVDLVDLDRAAPALRWRVARDGIVLVSAPAHEATRFLARTGIEHDELRDLEVDAQRRFRDRLAQGSAGTSR
jgi:predicted nucleotidyltransferase